MTADEKPAGVDAMPCSHPGCLSHRSHPCEQCGRIGGRPTADEKLAELRAAYPARHIKAVQCFGEDAYVASAHTNTCTIQGGVVVALPGDLLIVAKEAAEGAALDDLADALAKLEGVTIPRKVALALALASAGRWSKRYAVTRLMTDWWATQGDDWGDQVFAALGTTEDEAFAEMKEAQ